MPPLLPLRHLHNHLPLSTESWNEHTWFSDFGIRQKNDKRMSVSQDGCASIRESSHSCPHCAEIIQPCQLAWVYPSRRIGAQFWAGTSDCTCHQVRSDPHNLHVKQGLLMYILRHTVSLAVGAVRFIIHPARESPNITKVPNGS